MDRDPVIAAAVQKGVEAHLRRQRRMKADLLDMALPLPVYEAVRNQDLDLLAAFIAHPLFARYDFQPHLMDLALPGRNRVVIELIRSQVEPYASFDAGLFDAILDRDTEAIAKLDRDLFPEDYSLALEIETTYRQALSTLPDHPTALDYDVTRHLPGFGMHTSLQVDAHRHTLIDLSAYPDSAETQYFLQHLAQRYGVIEYETLKHLLLSALPAGVNGPQARYAPGLTPSEALRHPELRLRLEISRQLIDFIGDLKPLPDLLPECLAHETDSLARAGADALGGLFSLGAQTLLAAGASPNGLTKITWANLGTRKITALDVVNAHSGQISALLRESGGKRAHDLRREAQPEIEAMLADLNLAP